MTLDQAEKFRQQMVAAGSKSDGCTFAPELGTPCCQMHDYLRRFRPYGITAPQADVLLRECMTAKGHPVLAWVYYCAVVTARKLGIFQ